MRFITVVVLLLALATPATAHDEGAISPLFRDEAPLDLTLSGPIHRIANRAEQSTEAYPAILRAGDETLAIELSARGISRRHRENCRFPPLRVDIPGNPDETSLFDHQSRLKLVTHCNEGDRYQQYLLREYAAYRLYNLLTPEGFRVRLLRVIYRDEGGDALTRWGFFIEDIGDAARRLGGREIEIDRIPFNALDSRGAARFALFQYMIGNTDWAMTAGPAGEDCCHNSKLVGRGDASAGNLITLPYDFDMAGLVDAPYAETNSSLPIRQVTQRYYRGYCSFNGLVIEEAERFRQARPDMETMLSTIPGLSQASRGAMQRYLAGFFQDIATPVSIQRNLLSDCR